MTDRADKLARAVQNVLDEYGYIDISNTNGYADHGKVCESAIELGAELDAAWPVEEPEPAADWGHSEIKHF